MKVRNNQERVPKIGLVVSSDADDGFSDGINSIIASTGSLGASVAFEVISICDYPLERIAHESDVPDWWPEPAFNSALNWSRKLSSFDACLFLVDGKKGFSLLCNSLEYLESELDLKPVDSILINMDEESSGYLDRLRSHLIDRHVILITSGFELGTIEVDMLREPFDDYFPLHYEAKVDKALEDLVTVTAALWAKLGSHSNR